MMTAKPNVLRFGVHIFVLLPFRIKNWNMIRKNVFKYKTRRIGLVTKTNSGEEYVFYSPSHCLISWKLDISGTAGDFNG